MIAEEATDWPGVTRPTINDGLGFGMKWMMGWMHDTLDYFKVTPWERQHHQDKFAFSMMYYYDENFMLPLSHDEVVHGKSPMIYKMPGDMWQQCANLRLMYSYMWLHPGAKLLFMGDEFGQTTEWNYKTELDWPLLEHPSHQGVKACVADLNKLLRSEEALYCRQFRQEGFEWVDLNHREEAVMVFKRKGMKAADDLLIVLNMRPEVRYDWVVYTEGKEYGSEIFNSDLTKYWGSGNVFNPDIRTELVDKKLERYKLTVNLPPLGALVFK
jgi:1,4-alpha-glucan branching enzyme